MQKHKRRQGAMPVFNQGYGTHRRPTKQTPAKAEPTIEFRSVVGQSRLSKETLDFLAERDATERKVVNKYCEYMREKTELVEEVRMAIAVCVTRYYTYDQYEEACQKALQNPVSYKVYMSMRAVLPRDCCCPACGAQHDALDGCW